MEHLKFKHLNSTEWWVDFLIHINRRHTHFLFFLETSRSIYLSLFFSKRKEEKSVSWKTTLITSWKKVKRRLIETPEHSCFHSAWCATDNKNNPRHFWLYALNHTVSSGVKSKFCHSLCVDDISHNEKQITENYLLLHILSGIIHDYFYVRFNSGTS